MDGPYRSAGAPSGLPCPRCGDVLWRRALGYVSVAECSACEGVWVTRDALEKIVEDIALYVEVRASYPAGPPRGREDGPFYVRCPSCAEVMNRRLYAPEAKVIVDVCQAHGTWFDARELAAVVDWVESGALVAAQRAEAERKAAARAEAEEIIAGRQRRSFGTWLGAIYMRLIGMR